MSDPIANLISSINNARLGSNRTAKVPASRFKEDILNILSTQKTIEGYKKIHEGNHDYFTIKLSNDSKKLKKISKPGRRFYIRANKLKHHRQGFVVISTPFGVMTEKDARKRGVGGEVIMEVS